MVNTNLVQDFFFFLSSPKGSVEVNKGATYPNKVGGNFA